MTKETYNGWANYETWNFYMWEGELIRESVQEYQDQQEEELHYGQVYEIVEGHIDNILELSEIEATSGMLNDLLGHAIAKIDTHEVTSHILDELTFEQL